MEEYRNIDSIIRSFKDENLQFRLNSFMEQVVNFFNNNPELINIVHSLKHRIKDKDHLKEKILRKLQTQPDRTITCDNYLDEITDLVGVRVLHLYQAQFEKIHNEINNQVEHNKEWELVERPKAYTWDPETKEFYDSLGIDTELKDSFYTSVHYVIKPNNVASSIKCEIQVRTLFEEVWGEIDHSINYPQATSSIACKEQLRVLSKLISTGGRLVDSIIKSYEEFKGFDAHH